MISFLKIQTYDLKVLRPTYDANLLYRKNIDAEFEEPTPYSNRDMLWTNLKILKTCTHNPKMENQSSWGRVYYSMHDNPEICSLEFLWNYYLFQKYM